MLRWDRAVITSVLVMGCSNPGFLDEPACFTPVQDLSLDLTAHLSTNDGNEFFSYAPEGSLITQISGTYDSVSGDFSWAEMAASDAWFSRVDVVGYGYANPNGDLDVVGERVVEDVRGFESTQQFREVRVGCVVDREVRSWAFGGETSVVESGGYTTRGTYDYDIESTTNDITTEISGSRQATMEYTETRTAQSGQYELDAERTGNLAEGTYTETRTEQIPTGQGLLTRDGTWEFRRDGSKKVKMTQGVRGQNYLYEYEVDYFGNGSGTLSAGSTSCSMILTDGQCSYSCPGGQRGQCFVD